MRDGTTKKKKPFELRIWVGLFVLFKYGTLVFHPFMLLVVSCALFIWIVIIDLIKLLLLIQVTFECLDNCSVRKLTMLWVTLMEG